MLKTKTYRQDKRNPQAVSEAVAKSMRGNKAKDTKPELVLRKGLWAAGVRGYRLHWKKVPARPDVCFPSKKIAIFVHGCYWHRCPHCDLSLPKSHRAFWKNKFERNKMRDTEKTNQLEELGWRVHVLWECRIKKELDTCVQEVRNLLNG